MEENFYEGVVVAYTTKGYGFVETEKTDEFGSRRHFIHWENITGMPGFRWLPVGERVQFQLRESARHAGKLECFNLIVIDDGGDR